MDRSAIGLERDGAVAIVTLDRPDHGNAIDEALARGLLEVASICDTDAAIRTVLLTGAGRMFCAGGDINAFAAAGDAAPRIVTEQAAVFHGAISRLLRMDKPLVTAINGPAAGAGLSLAAIGDIALAAPEAHFTLGYGAIGFSPDGGASWLLPRLIGLRRTQDLMLTNRRIGAQEAAAIGLVTRVVGVDRLAEEALSLARTLAAGATRAIGRTRALLLDGYGAGPETQMEREARAIATSSGDPEGREGVAAFLAKRPPRFDGGAT